MSDSVTSRTVVHQALLSMEFSREEFQSGFICCAVLSHSRVQLFATPWTIARQAPLSMGILQARILEWVSMPSSRESSQPKDFFFFLRR